MERMLAEEVDRRQFERMTAYTALLILEYLCTGKQKEHCKLFLVKSVSKIINQVLMKKKIELN